MCQYGKIFRFGVNKVPMISWFPKIQTRLRTTFISPDWVYNQNDLDLLRNLGVLIFGQKWKNLPCRYGKNFRFGVIKFLMISWFPMIQNRLLKTFYQSRLGIQPKYSDILRNLWVWIFIAYAQKSPERFCIYAIVSAQTLLHNEIVSSRTHLRMQLCSSEQNCPCSKLNALGRRYAFAIFFLQAVCKSMSWMTWEILMLHKRRFSACTLAYARTYM